MSAIVWVGVGLLGGIGALARFLLDGFLAARAAGALPWGTFAVNISGALALGLLAGLALDGDAFLLAGTALIGSYTTFSTWMLESDRSVEERSARVAILNLALTFAAGLGAAELGRLLGEAV